MKDWLDDIQIDAEELDLPIMPSESAEEEEWLTQRLGNITGSNFGKLVKKDKQGGYMLSTGKVAENLIYKIAWERLLKEGNISNGLGRLSVSSQAITHGNDYEQLAITKYEEETNRKVERTQRYVALDDFIGGTPDGFIGKDGIIEVKCPFNGGNHLKTLLTGEIYNQEYIYQIQGYLLITGCKWCDFVTYDPDLIDGLQLTITRVERDEVVISAIAEILDEVKEKIKDIIKQINKK